MRRHKFPGRYKPMRPPQDYPAFVCTRLYDTIIKSGTVIDPSQSLNAVRDVGIKNGLVAAVSASLNASDACEVYDATGLLVFPGLIDILSHNWPDGVILGVAPDDHCLQCATTTVSPGDFGAPAVSAFRKTAVEQSTARVFGWVMASRVGYSPFPATTIGILSYANEDDMANALIDNWDILLGIKVLTGYAITGHLAAGDDLVPLTRALSARDTAETATGKTFALMVHIGGQRTTTQLADIVNLLRAGDIITHAFNGIPNQVGAATGFAQGGAPIAAIYTATGNGILLDSGFGSVSFDFITATICMYPLNTGSPGSRLDLMSSDNFSAAAGVGTAKTLPDAMSIMYGLNKPYNINFTGGGPLPNFNTLTDLSPAITIDDIVRANTETAAAVIGDRYPLIGTLQTGAPGDVSIMELETGSYSYTDYPGAYTLTTTKRFAPVQCYVGGVAMIP